MTDNVPEGAPSPSDTEPDDGEHVRQLDEHRYLVRTENLGDEADEADHGTSESEVDDGPDRSADDLGDLPGAYAIRAHARSETAESAFGVGTNDVSETFEAFLRWYAEQVAEDTPVEAVLAVLLEHSDLELDVRLP